jgi:hypothetical protein
MTVNAIDSFSKRALFTLISLLRLFLIAAALTIITTEILEIYQEKDLLHLSMFSIFFLLSNFQVNLSRHTAVMKSEERISRLFVLALFTLSAAFLELVDLGFDQITDNLKYSTVLMSGYQIVCIFETACGVMAVLLIAYSIDRMLVTLRSTAYDYRKISL